jgi:hypothetical protein
MDIRIAFLSEQQQTSTPALSAMQAEHTRLRNRIAALQAELKEERARRERDKRAQSQPPEVCVCLCVSCCAEWCRCRAVFSSQLWTCSQLQRGEGDPKAFPSPFWCSIASHFHALQQTGRKVRHREKREGPAASCGARWRHCRATHQQGSQDARDFHNGEDHACWSYRCPKVERQDQKCS